MFQTSNTKCLCTLPLLKGFFFTGHVTSNVVVEVGRWTLGSGIYGSGVKALHMQSSKFNPCCPTDTYYDDVWLLWAPALNLWTHCQMSLGTVWESIPQNCGL